MMSRVFPSRSFTHSSVIVAPNDTNFAVTEPSGAVNVVRSNGYVRVQRPFMSRKPKPRTQSGACGIASAPKHTCTKAKAGRTKLMIVFAENMFARPRDEIEP